MAPSLAKRPPHNNLKPPKTLVTHDAATDLYYYRARWYDAVTGGFLGEDPLSFAAGDPNLSRYCGNSPTNFTDPSGTETLASRKLSSRRHDPPRDSSYRTVIQEVVYETSPTSIVKFSDAYAWRGMVQCSAAWLGGDTAAGLPYYSGGGEVGGVRPVPISCAAGTNDEPGWFERKFNEWWDYLLTPTPYEPLPGQNAHNPSNTPTVGDLGSAHDPDKDAGTIDGRQNPNIGPFPMPGGVALPANNGPTLGWLITDKGFAVFISSNSPHNPKYTYPAAKHAEGKAAIYLQEHPNCYNKCAVFFHNYSNGGTCPMCHSNLPYLLPTGAVLTVVPPPNATPKKGWHNGPTTYVGL